MSLSHCPQCDQDVDDGARFCPNCGENLIEVSSTTNDEYIGQTLRGFLIHELIGLGAMGRVYKGEQLSLGKTVAIKILHRHLLGDPSLEKRFQREARAAAKLQHPNCILVIDFGKGDDGALYIAMEYLDGPNLGQILQEGPMPWPRAIKILDQVASALDEAHSEGIIHRDLKPENIVVENRRNEEDFVKVLDFGIAKVAESDNREGVLTMVGAVCGTPEYMAPEQARGEIDLDVRADIYAMGCILYQMLTGELPFSGDSVMAVVTKQLTEIPIEPRVRRPDLDIPPSIERLCMKALSKDREDRPASAMIFGQDLTAMGAALHSGVFEARTSSQVPEGSEEDGLQAQEVTLPPAATALRRGRVMPNSALATGEAVLASIPAPSGLQEVDDLGRAQTPPLHLLGLGDTLVREDGHDSSTDGPLTDQARIATFESDLPPDDEQPPVRAPTGGADPSKTNPATPLHPTPVLAGEVIDTGQTAVYHEASASRGKFAVAAALGVVAALGAVWALTEGPPQAPPNAPIVTASAAPPAVAPPVDEPTFKQSAPVSAPIPEEAERAAAEEVSDADEADSLDRPRKKSKRRARKKRAPQEPDAALPPPKVLAQPPAPSRPAADAPQKAKISRAQALFDQAGGAFAKGKHPEAISLYREALVAGYRQADIHYQLGRAYMRMSKPQEARGQFETYLRKYPKSPKRKVVEAILKQGR